MTTNLKIDNLEATSLKLNGQEVDSIVTPEELDCKIEEVEGKIDEKCAETLEDAKAYTDSKAGGGGFSVYVQDEQTIGTLSQNINLTNKANFKSLFDSCNWNDESLILGEVKYDSESKAFWFYNSQQNEEVWVSYWCMETGDIGDFYHNMSISPDSGRGYNGKIWYDSKNDRIWFEHEIA